MRKKNAKCLFVAALFSMSGTHDVSAEKQEVHRSAGDAFQHVYIGGDVGFSGSNCELDCVFDGYMETGKEGVPATYYDVTGAVVTPPVPFTGEVLDFQTKYFFDIGDFIGARGNQFRLDLVLGGNAHVGSDVLFGADVLMRYMPGTINGFGYIRADMVTDVSGAPASLQEYTLTDFSNCLISDTPHGPCSFLYDGSGFTEIAIHNSWTLDFLVNVGYALSPAVSFLFKAGVSLGFWRTGGVLNFSSTENMKWYNYSTMDMNAGVTFPVTHAFEYASEEPEEIEENFSQNSTFVGLVLAPTVQMRISQGVVAFLKIELSLYPKKELSFDIEDVGTLDMTVQNLNTVSGLVGIVYTFGGK